MRDESYKEYFRRNLPHIHPIGATLFVTFRLHGSIPQALLDDYQLKKSWLEQQKFQGKLKTENEELEFHRYWFRTFEDALHNNNSGPAWFGEENVAAIMQESLHYRDNKDYRLDAYCIMPNHVHVVFAPYLSEKELAAYQTNRGLRFTSKVFTTSKIMESLKGFTARKCNKVLGRSGAFWNEKVMTMSFVMKQSFIVSCVIFCRIR